MAVGWVVSNTRLLYAHLQMLVKHLRSLPDRQSSFGAMLDGLREKVLRFFQVISCVEKPIDSCAVFGPLL